MEEVEEAIAKGEIEMVRIKEIKAFLLKKGVSEENFRHLRLKRDLFEFAEQVAREGDSPSNLPARVSPIRKDPLKAETKKATGVTEHQHVPSEAQNATPCECDKSKGRERASTRLHTPPPLIFP